MQPGTVPGAVLELHAAKASGGTAPGSNDPLTTEWYDTSGNGNHGTLVNFTGTPWSADGLTFPAGTAHVAVEPLSESADRIVSYELWISGFTLADTRYALTEAEVGGGKGTTGIRFASGKATLRFYDDLDHGGNAGGSYAVNDGELHHIVDTADGTTGLAYVDGEVDPVSLALPTGTVTVNTLAVGCLLRSVVGYPFGGVIHLARIYPFALTPEQVAANYAVGLAWSGLPPHILRPVYLPQGIVL